VLTKGTWVNRIQGGCRPLLGFLKWGKEGDCSEASWLGRGGVIVSSSSTHWRHCHLWLALVAMRLPQLRSFTPVASAPSPSPLLFALPFPWQLRFTTPPLLFQLWEHQQNITFACFTIFEYATQRRLICAHGCAAIPTVHL
jgi:hypothetical protein